MADESQNPAVETHTPPPPSRGEWFTTTHWSVVLAAADPESAQARRALETLCRNYWYPLYAFIRRQGQPVEEAKDLTQAFFERLLEKQYLGQADPQRGRFRSFLLASLKHFLADEWDKLRARKRGGGRPLVALDAQDAEARYRLEPVDTHSPEVIYERRWALTVLDQAAHRLEQEFLESGKGDLFDRLRRFLAGEWPDHSYAQAAALLQMPENTLKSHVHRLRQRNRELIRDVIAETVAAPAEVDEEIRHLISLLSQ